MTPSTAGWGLAAMLAAGEATPSVIATGNVLGPAPVAAVRVGDRAIRLFS